MRLKLTIFALLSATFLGVAGIGSCKKTDTGVSPTKTTPLEFVVPAGFPAPVYNFTANPLTKEGFALGESCFMMANFQKTAISLALLATRILQPLPPMTIT